MVNKIDVRKAREAALQFYELGFDPLFEVSGEHGTGVGDLLDEIARRLKKSDHAARDTDAAADEHGHGHDGERATRGAFPVARMPERDIERDGGHRCQVRPFQCVEQVVQQIADASAMLARDLEERVEAQLVELERRLAAFRASILLTTARIGVSVARSSATISRSPGTRPC